MITERNRGSKSIKHPSDTYVIIDLEWNQPIPWIRSRIDPKKLPGEIIEIGAVKLTVDDQGVHLSRPFHVLIRPVCYTIMNKSVSRVINKISSDLKNGMTFLDAYDAFADWCGPDHIICGWGNSDLSILKANLRFHGRSALLGRRFLDVQMLFAKVAENGNAQRSVEYAVDFLKIPKREDFHEAHRDAEYTGKILKALFETLENEDADVFLVDQYLFDPDLNVHSERRTDYFDSRDACCRQTFSEEVLCPACGAPLREELKWFRIRKSAFALFRCERHNRVVGRIRLKKTPDKKVYASVVLKLAQPGQTKPVTDRYEEYLEFGSAGRPIDRVLSEESNETISRGN